MPSASRDANPREREGWCLPGSADILELAIQQWPTRGGTDASYIGMAVQAASCTLAVISQKGRKPTLVGDTMRARSPIESLYQFRGGYSAALFGP